MRRVYAQALYRRYICVFGTAVGPAAMQYALCIGIKSVFRGAEIIGSFMRHLCVVYVTHITGFKHIHKRAHSGNHSGVNMRRCRCAFKTQNMRFWGQIYTRYLCVTYAHYMS